MAHSAVLAIPGRFFFWEFQVGVVHSVCTKGVGAAHFFKQTCYNCHPPVYILTTL